MWRAEGGTVARAWEIVVGFLDAETQLGFAPHGACTIQVPRHVGNIVGAVDNPHPKTEEGHASGHGVEEVPWEEVPTSTVLLY
jgi:hypothetical protein